MSVPLSFSYYAHIPMVNLPGGMFVRGASDMTHNPPTWREVSPFSVSLSHVTECEFLGIAEKAEGEWKWLYDIEGAYRARWSRPLGPTAHPMTCVSWHDAKKFLRNPVELHEAARSWPFRSSDGRPSGIRDPRPRR